MLSGSFGFALQLICHVGVVPTVMSRKRNILCAFISFAFRFHSEAFGITHPAASNGGIIPHFLTP